MVKVDILTKEGKVSKIKELELERYINFFDMSYKDNLAHSQANKESFPRWSIISGYYAMHDITKLLLAKEFRLKIEFEVHATTIKVLSELIKDKSIINLIQQGHKNFITLANDLAQGKKERVKVQYYTGSAFMHKEFIKKADEFLKEIVLIYIKKIGEIL